jgi:hypothetical protein
MSESATEAYASVERSSKSGFDRHDFDNLGAGLQFVAKTASRVLRKGWAA